ncbi:hypothetical protein [Pseudomonas frederiksbergensis]|uniref:hypothetical protein n=1 Tax=Pseudomonas frederiksbergensis TaxID=104087 RepID=UPI00191C7908
MGGNVTFARVRWNRLDGVTDVPALVGRGLLPRLHGGQGYLEKDPATLIHLYREPDSKD